LRAWLTGGMVESGGGGGGVLQGGCCVVECSLRCREVINYKGVVTAFDQGFKEVDLQYGFGWLD
jgi:hypothetical protein